MAKVYAFAADGCEECELLNVVNVLLRGGIDTKIVSINKEKTVVSAHGINFQADLTLDDTDFADADLLFLPGGMPGSVNLSKCSKLIDIIANHLNEGKRVAAICAAPSVVLGQHGFLKGIKATCYPGFEDGLLGATYCKDKVVTDSLFTTARGLGCSFELGFEIINLLLSKQTSEEISMAIQYTIK